MRRLFGADAICRADRSGAKNGTCGGGSRGGGGANRTRDPRIGGACHIRFNDGVKLRSQIGVKRAAGGAMLRDALIPVRSTHFDGG